MRIRIAKKKLDERVRALFSEIQIQDEKARDWFLRVLWAHPREGQQVDQK